MLTPQIKVTTREPQIRPGDANGIDIFRGLGWVIDTTLEGDICYHSGANGSGFKCYSQFNRKKGSGIVIMTNGSGGLGVWDTIARAYRSMKLTTIFMHSQHKKRGCFETALIH
ncbi:hypothetical protein MASR1M107_15330 [Ignavibacteriales bacterium]